MSYRIEYDSGAGKYEVVENQSLFPIFLVAAVVFLLAISLWPEGRTTFFSWLIPGDDTVTVQAFSSMTDDLRCGAGLWEAVEGFCRAVIHGR
jgi:hypothetical protein